MEKWRISAFMFKVENDWPKFLLSLFYLLLPYFCFTLQPIADTIENYISPSLSSTPLTSVTRFMKICHFG